MLLKVLVDKRISDLPNNFTESHEVAISMQLKDDSTFNDDKHFSIVIDAVDDDQEEIQEQMYLKLEEEDGGTIKVLDQICEKVNYEPILEKAGSTANDHMLGEIEIDDGKRIRITTKHIFILESDGDETEITHVFENRNISRFIYVDGKWVYAL